MIGKIGISLCPYYNTQTNKKSFKKRPILIIGGPRNNDYTVLPISTVSRKENLDAKYDVEVIPAQYPNLNLHNTSYIRVHKQTTIHHSEILRIIGDLKSEYGELYLKILMLLEEFNQETLDASL
ncbi:type II toxin-antitoxin system PemK/MazF family toxin [Anaerovoracaceae bacterium 42-11]